jgi:hypothetical protein
MFQDIKQESKFLLLEMHLLDRVNFYGTLVDITLNYQSSWWKEIEFCRFDLKRI